MSVCFECMLLQRYGFDGRKTLAGKNSYPFIVQKLSIFVNFCFQFSAFKQSVPDKVQRNNFIFLTNEDKRPYPSSINKENKKCASGSFLGSIYFGSARTCLIALDALLDVYNKWPSQ